MIIATETSLNRYLYFRKATIMTRQLAKHLGGAGKAGKETEIFSSCEFNKNPRGIGYQYLEKIEANFFQGRFQGCPGIRNPKQKPRT